MTELERRIADAGLKMTGQRRLILQVLDDSPDHPSVETVHERARAIDPGISLATVYRTLQVLADLEIVQRHAFNDEPARFDTNTEHHHHLIDLESGAVIEFQSEELEALKQRIAEKLGYELTDHRLELYGHKKPSR